jgi:TRAP-type C4-dicarboxylate transport system permease small subunit
MIATFMNAVAVLFVLVLLVVFVWGAWRHTVEQTLADPILADPSPHAKTKRYFRLLGKVLWNIAVPVVMVGAVLVEFMGLMAESKNDEDQTRWHGGCLWHRDITGAWYSYSADENTPEPPLF